MLEFFETHWLLNTLLVTLAIGLVAFINKVFAERHFDQRFVAIVLFGLLCLITLGSLLLLESKALSLLETMLALAFGAQMYSYTLIMIATLRYLPTATFFISVRLISSFALLIIGVWYFKDVLDTYDILGFILGAGALALLFEPEEKVGSNYQKGIV